jgi:hypothetical protein
MYAEQAARHTSQRAIEFSFLFVASMLYAIHAVLAPVAYFVRSTSASGTARPSLTAPSTSLLFNRSSNALDHDTKQAVARARRGRP